MPSFIGYDIKKRKKVRIPHGKEVRLKNKRRALVGVSPLSGNKVYRIIGMAKKRK